MGRVLDLDNVDVSQARTNEESYLNYSLATDNELMSMMNFGISPMDHAQLVEHLSDHPPSKGEKKRYKLHVHAECKLLAHFVDAGIRAYPYFATSKLACVACWLFFEAYNELVNEKNQKGDGPRLDAFHVRGCHSHVYQWAAPDFSLRDTVLDRMAVNAEKFFRSLRGKRRGHSLTESSTGSLSSQVSVNFPWNEMHD